MVLDDAICNHLWRSLFLSLSDAHTHASRIAAARASPRASAAAEEMWKMHAVCVEGTARAVQGATASQTAARPLISVACATEAESPRAPAIATDTCWTNAGYAPKVLMCEEKCTHRASLISDSMQIELDLGPYTMIVSCAAGSHDLSNVMCRPLRDHKTWCGKK